MATDSIKCSLQVQEDEIEPFLSEDKLSSTVEPGRNECKCSRLRTSRVELLKMVGPLVRFHAMNALVAVEAALLMAVMVQTVACVPGWLLGITYLFLLVAVFKRIPSVPHEGLKAFARVLLAVLWWLSLTNTYTLYVITVIPCAAFVAIIGFTSSYSISEFLAVILVTIDIELVQSLDSVSPVDSEANQLDVDECAGRFESQDPCVGVGDLKIDASTCRMWATIFYCAMIKVFAGVVSSVVLVLAVVQPVVAIYILGYDPFTSNWIMLRENAAGYMTTSILLWIVGVVGLPMAAKLSVKLTVFTCGLWKSVLPAPNLESEVDPTSV